jgi:hypothetical protein
MSALSIFPAFPVFTGLDGQPLDNGFIWIGQPSLDPQTNPAAVYWDEALSIAAPQPIRTLAGYPSRSGTPARIYCDGAFSIRVQDNKGVTVYNDLLISNVNGSPLVIDNGAEQLTIELDGSDFTFNHTQAGDFLTYDDATGEFTIASDGQTVNIQGLTVIESAESGGANLKLTGTFGSPAAPSKYLRSLAGVLEVINSAYTTPLVQVYDSGDFAFNSGFGTSRVAYGCRAWVNFNGTGTVAILGSGGVSSITDNGTGDYTVNFSSAMTDANFSASAIAKEFMGAKRFACTAEVMTPSASSYRVEICDTSFALADSAEIHVAIHR